MEQPAADHTILFDWDLSEFDRLIENCEFDDSIALALTYLSRWGKVLEAGCGPGHVIAYLAAKGFDIEGAELSAPIVNAMNGLRPDLPIRLGDVGRMDVRDGHYTGLLSFGVIEHFRTGPAEVLAEHRRVLAPGGIAVISVPSLTWVRRLKRRWYFGARHLRPSLNPWLRRLAHRPPVKFNRRGETGFVYEVNPMRGDFFEYHLRPTEFECAVRDAGFTILESRPTHHAVGLWIEFGEWAARNERRRFTPTAVGGLLHRLMSIRPFLHNHMHTIVARK